MGTFGSYVEPKDAIFPIGKRKEFIQNMSRLMYLGGMMRLDRVNMFGMELILIDPVSLSLDEQIEFHYNYFEDNSWESVIFNPEKCWLSSEKIGGREFNDVIMAGHRLYEHYIGVGFAECNGDILPHTEYTGWINQALGTSFSMKNRFRLWERAEEYLDWKEYEDGIGTDIIWDIIPSGLEQFAGGMDLTDLLYIINGTDELTLDNNEILEGSYPDDIRRCRQLLDVYYQKTGKGDIEDLWSLLKRDRKSREKEASDKLKEIAKMSLFMPARVFVYLTAEKFEDVKFWEVWMKYREEFYRDEVRKPYASEELAAWRKEGREKPIDPVRTSEFLRQDGYFTFFDTPDEIRELPNYYVSDDDRMFWWDGSDEVQISEKTEAWLRELASEHKELKTSKDILEVGGDFLKFFLSALVDADQYYQRLFPFQSMFYEFLQNGRDPNYIAAVKLYKRLADSEDYRKNGGIIKYANNKCWDLVSKNITCNIARTNLKRYLSVMANRKLREKFFGF